MTQWLSLIVQLQTFVNSYKIKTLSEAHNVFQEMVPEVRSLFVGVEQLVRLMLLCFQLSHQLSLCYALTASFLYMYIICC